jgi:hypothetical protein
LAAHAQTSTRVAVTDTLTVEHRTDNRNGFDNDDNYSALLNRLNLTGNAGDLATAVRIDSFYFVGADEDRYRNLTSLERINLRYRMGNLRMEFGDFYQQLGRGIALSLRKNDEAGLDVAIRGAALTWQDDLQRIHVFGGYVNPVNIDVVTQQFIEDTEDIALGGEYRLDAIPGVQWGLYGLYLEPARSAFDELAPSVQNILLEANGRSIRRDHSETVGATLNLPAPTEWLSVYAEALVQSTDISDEVNRGDAQYVSVDIAAGRWVALVEGVRLNRVQPIASRNTVLGNTFLYNIPPSLERFDQEVLNLTHYQGTRLRLERAVVGNDLLVNVNGMVRQTTPGEATETLQLHGYAGIEGYYGGGTSRLLLNGGYRDESRTGDNAGSGFKTLRHFDVDWLQHIAGEWALHIQSFNEFRTLEGVPFQRGSTLTGFERAGLGALTYEFGYDTTNRAEGVRNWFHAGILQWFISPRLTLQATGGTQRGGIKCINGVCRNYPGFAGGSATLIGRF